MCQGCGCWNFKVYEFQVENWEFQATQWQWALSLCPNSDFLGHSFALEAGGKLTFLRAAQIDLEATKGNYIDLLQIQEACHVSGHVTPLPWLCGSLEEAVEALSDCKWLHG